LPNFQQGAGLPAGQQIHYTGANIIYGSCNAKAFVNGDKVIVDLHKGEGVPTVIGFYENPKMCPGGESGGAPILVDIYHLSGGLISSALTDFISGDALAYDAQQINGMQAYQINASARHSVVANKSVPTPYVRLPQGYLVFDWEYLSDGNGSTVTVGDEFFKTQTITESKTSSWYSRLILAGTVFQAIMQDYGMEITLSQGVQANSYASFKSRTRASSRVFPTYEQHIDAFLDTATKSTNTYDLYVYTDDAHNYVNRTETVIERSSTLVSDQLAMVTETTTKTVSKYMAGADPVIISLNVATTTASVDTQALVSSDSDLSVAGEQTISWPIYGLIESRQAISPILRF